MSLIILFNNLFSGRSVFNEDISQWNVSNAASMEAMFYVASTFDQYLYEWNLYKVTNFTDMFTGATAMLTRYPILSTVEWIQEYFALPYIPASNADIFNAISCFFDNTKALPSGVNNTQFSINKLTLWEVSLITIFDNLFSGRSVFKQDISQ